MGSDLNGELVAGTSRSNRLTEVLVTLRVLRDAVIAGNRSGSCGNGRYYIPLRLDDGAAGQSRAVVEARIVGRCLIHFR